MKRFERALWLAGAGTIVMVVAVGLEGDFFFAAELAAIALGCLLSALIVRRSTRGASVTPEWALFTILTLAVSIGVGGWNRHHERTVERNFITVCLTSGLAEACENARSVCDYWKWRGDEPLECASVRRVLSLEARR
ncbi:MAG: hypothetical protein HY049_16985 [Acidobacteria bacterium]|nr:hypothetical protein [Acidobacteriota bacterium]